MNREILGLFIIFLIKKKIPHVPEYKKELIEQNRMLVVCYSLDLVSIGSGRFKYFIPCIPEIAAAFFCVLTKVVQPLNGLQRW